ncbi:DUF4760 domain-containing protein [Enterococcus dispar]|uniref:DUF4760 domain-containing protein n=1 Tax=Enterococcus dispar TaxID=44009 RepID=UPI002891149D|nr:hypothetical protein [Enterococcus dispar]MDT2704940.1 hypothetical protein [Enterococcus dispar]
MLHDFIISDFYKDLKDVAQFIASLVSIIGIIGILINVRKYRVDAEQREYDITFKRKQISVDILHKFATVIIPEIDKFNDLVRKELSPKAIEQLEAADSNKKKEILINIYLQSDAIPVMNQLEQICTYVKADLADETLLYEPMHTTLVSFFDRVQPLLDRLAELNIPFENLRYVVEKWKVNEKNKQIDAQIKELEKLRPGNK